MIIQIDTREKQKAIKKILAEFENQNIKCISSKLYVGDYMSLDNPRLVIDRKQNLLELCSNVCQQHKRFISEIQRAADADIKIVFLVEHSKNVKSIDDVQYWVNPRLKDHPLAMSGERLYKVLCTLELKYGVEFRLCSKDETGKRIIEILGGKQNEDN